MTEVIPDGFEQRDRRPYVETSGYARAKWPIPHDTRSGMGPTATMNIRVSAIELISAAPGMLSATSPARLKLPGRRGIDNSIDEAMAVTAGTHVTVHADGSA